MPEAATVDATTSATTNTVNTGTNGGDAQSLGWRAGLPDDLKQNTDLANYKTVGDFAKEAITWKGKVGELEGKLGDSIPKLPDDASEEDRATYFDALGRPKVASEYEFDGEDKNAPEWTNAWKDAFHRHGLTKQQGKELSKEFNGQIGRLIEAQKTLVANEMKSAEQALRTEMGDKYDTNVELAKRMYSKHIGKEFDADFEAAPPAARFGMTRLLLKVAALTGEDTSPQAGLSQNKKADTGLAINYDKSPAPPPKR